MLAVMTAMLSALGTAALVLRTTEASIQRVVLTAAREDRERSARLFGSKVSVLRDALAAVAARIPREHWNDTRAMGAYLLDKHALGTMFRSVFSATPDGRMLARVEAGALASELPNIDDRDYFRHALSSDQPVISEVIRSKVLNTPIVVIAIPVLDQQGQHIGVLAGSLALQSTAMFDDLRSTAQDDAIHDLVIDRAGRVLAHEDPTRVMLRAEDEPGLREVMQEWLSSGSPIDTIGTASVRGEYVVSIAGIPLSDWLNVRLTKTEVALAPVAQAREAALPAALLAGLLAGLVAGALGYAITRPISRLRQRAESLLDDSGGISRWPDDAGEVGKLANAFRHVVEQRERRQTEVQALLHQLEAVLDHAEVGIALTRSGRFELVSQQFCEMFRCERIAVVGQSTRTIYPSDEAYEALSAEAGPALSQLGVFDAELELLRHNGQVFWARMRGRAVVPGEAAQGTIWTIEDVTAAREHREHLSHTASHDALTGLVNRAAFEVLLGAATASAAAEPYCALFIDLDRFKQVNDTGGHAAGDALLRDVAKVLVQQVRNTDTVARLGGDEFAVLLPRCPPAQARTIADKLCAAVQAYELQWEGARFSVGASVGMVPVDGGFRTEADVLRAADSACYVAKKRGRNRVEVYLPSDFQEMTA